MDKPMDVVAHAGGPVHVAHVDPLRPLLWLRLGWDDIRHNLGPSIAHRLILVMLGELLVAIHRCNTPHSPFSAPL